MASSRNLALRILITAKDAASGVLHGVGKAFADIRTQIAGLLVSLGLMQQAIGAIGAAAAMEDLVAQFAALEGSAGAGAQKLKEIEGAFGLRQVDEAARLYAQLAAFGLKPTVEQLGDLIDFNARTGKGAENLNGIVAQLGQAWGKQKLQYEDILILLERGVPVWELLGNATGVATAELGKMASEGELGRKAISLLISEMGKMGEGAGAARLTTWNGLVESASGLWTRFQATMANAGVFEQAKSYLSAIADALERAITDGSAARWGAQIAEATAAIGERLRGLLGDARAVFGEWSATLSSWAVGTRETIAGVTLAWEGYRTAISGIATFVATVLARSQSGTATVMEGLSRLGLVSEEAAQKSRALAESMAESARQNAENAKRHWGAAGDAFADMAGVQEGGARQIEQAAEDAVAANTDWVSSVTMLRNEQATLNVTMSAGTASAKAQGDAAKQAGSATGVAAAGAKLGADALRDHAVASKEATKASKDLADAQADLAKAQQTKGREKDPYGWEDAAMAAAKAASEINSGQADKAIETITNAYRGLAEAVERGDTSAGIEVVARQLDGLAKRAEKAAKAVKEVTEGGKESGDKADTKADTKEKAKTGAGERAAVEQAFAKPIPLTFDVAAGAAAAATQVADAIVTAVTQRLAGAKFSVPVTAIVTVDAGGADEISLESAKRGSRTP